MLKYTIEGKPQKIFFSAANKYMYEIWNAQGVESHIFLPEVKGKNKIITRIVRTCGWRLLGNFIQSFFIKMRETHSDVCRMRRQVKFWQLKGLPKIRNEEWSWVICDHFASLTCTWDHPNAQWFHTGPHLNGKDWIFHSYLHRGTGLLWWGSLHALDMWSQM